MTYKSIRPKVFLRYGPLKSNENNTKSALSYMDSSDLGYIDFCHLNIHEWNSVANNTLFIITIMQFELIEKTFS